MITCLEITDNKKTGNLGNKLFIIAAMIGYAVKNNESFILPHWEYESFFPNIPISGVKNIWIDSFYLEPHYHYNEIKVAYRNSRNIRQKIQRIKTLDQFSLFIRNSVRLTFTKSMHIDLFGYFQSERYFDFCKDKVREYFSPSLDVKNIVNKLWNDLQKKIDSKPTVMVQIRRGIDYDNDDHGLLPMNYYTEAFREFQDHKFLMFSNDIAWCKSNFVNENIIFIDNTSPVVDMFLGAMCDHAIIPNSTFSWWTAWLIKNKNKRVVAPKNWFGSARRKTHNTKDLFNENWILI